MYAAETPKLLKSRMRHTRLFMLALFPLLAVSAGLAGDDSFTHEVLDWTGYFLVIVCVLGRAYCSAYIGGRKNDEVVDTGPFGVVRNPLYVFSFIGIMGMGMQSGILLVPLGLLLVFMVYYPRVVAREEAFLLHRFGAPYEDYMRRVPRWIPKFSLWKEPHELVIRPRFIRETMLDASLFFLALPLFELLEDLHAQGILPSFFLLP